MLSGSHEPCFLGHLSRQSSGRVQRSPSAAQQLVAAYKLSPILWINPHLFTEAEDYSREVISNY
jgi:hypothetical protein